MNEDLAASAIGNAPMAQVLLDTAIATALDDGRPQLLEMVETIDDEIERREQSARVQAMLGSPYCQRPEWARKHLALRYAAKTLRLILDNESLVWAALRAARAPVRKRETPE